MQTPFADVSRADFFSFHPNPNRHLSGVVSSDAPMTLPVSPVLSSTDWFAIYRQGHLTNAFNFISWIYAPLEVAHLIQWLLNGGRTGQLGAGTSPPRYDHWLVIHGSSHASVDAMATSFPTFPW